MVCKQAVCVCVWDKGKGMMAGQEARKELYPILGSGETSGLEITHKRNDFKRSDAIPKRTRLMRALNHGCCPFVAVLTPSSRQTGKTEESGNPRAPNNCPFAHCRLYSLYRRYRLYRLYKLYRLCRRCRLYRLYRRCILCRRCTSCSCRLLQTFADFTDVADF